MSAIPKSVRYDPSGLLGSPSPVNIIIGARSLGKTYGFTKYAIRDYINNNNQWVYLRRYDTELTDSRTGDSQSFFSQIVLNSEFPDYDFRVLGNQMQMTKTDQTNDKGKQVWDTFGYMLALSKAQSYKGMNLANVKTIFYDEFILEKRVPPYLPNEPDRLLNLWETIDRRNDRTRLYLAANAADIVNPYFTGWGLQLPSKGKTKTYKYRNSSITIQYADDAKFREYAKQTNIGAFTAGSSYEQYALENTFINAGEHLLMDKPSSALFRFALVMKGKEFGVWIDVKEGNWFVNTKTPSEPYESFTLIRDDLRPNIIMLERTNPIMRRMKRAIMEGFLFFDTIQTRQQFLVNMELLGIR